MARKLRVLNAVRQHDIAMPLTLEQFSTQGVPVLIQRLIKARKHLLALRIAELLNEPTKEVGIIRRTSLLEYELKDKPELMIKEPLP